MQAFFSFTYTFYLLILSSWAETEYCDIPTCPPGTQTLCRYPVPGPSSECDDYNEVPLTDSEVEELIDQDQALKLMIANGPEGLGAQSSDSIILRWDPELAEIAQRWADQCALGEDVCRNLEDFFVEQIILQSIYSTNGTLLEEVAIFDTDSDPSYSYELEEELLVAYIIGCGRAQFRMGSNIILSMVCNYAPDGPDVPVAMEVDLSID